MENTKKDQIAIALFTGAIIALFLFIENLVEISILNVIILLIFFVIIAISLKIILDPSADLHVIGNIIRKMLNIKS